MAKAGYIGHCALCEREQKLSFHHLIPRTCHKNKWFQKNYDRQDMLTRGLDLCRDCHLFIHHTWPEKHLGRYLASKEDLLATEELQRFLPWVRKKH